MLNTLFRRSAFGLALSVMLISIFVFSSASNVRASGFAFTNFELGTTAGTICPEFEGKNCTNFAAEPQIRGSKDGHFFASSENGVGDDTDAWRSDDGGLHYVTLPSPNKAGNTLPGGVGGGDTDLAVAPVENSNKNYNVYVASLTLANVTVSTSMNNGGTWQINPAAATIPGDDREWIAADGSAKVCISYHDVATFNIDVNCSYNAGTTFTQLGDAIDTTHAYNIDNNEIGNLAIDPTSHIVYQTFSGIDSGDVTACATTGPCNYHVVYMAVSTDGGQHFTDQVVYDNPNRNVSYGHQFVNVSVDKAGNVYSVYSDNHNVYYSYSTNHGTTWSAPTQVNKTPSNTAIEPWSVANGAGHIDIVWYGTSYSSSTIPPDNFPISAAWHVYMAQNLHATTTGSSFTQVAASPINHYGGVCEGGVSCTGNSAQNRDLYDDFGVGVYLKPGASNYGFASIVYSDDQYTNNTNNPPQANCTTATTNTGSCDHTAIATQTSGTGI
ncbi:MAG: hypothetical protein NVS4B7_20410 [Ktedonobacteraceae bacterium]